MRSSEDQEELETIVETAYQFLWKHHVCSCPVDIEQMARREGVEVLRTRIREPECSGILVGHAAWPVIYLRDADSEERQRFTIAHELFHFLVGDSPMHLCLDFGLLGQPEPWEERKADRFAAEVLMPANWLQLFVDHGERFTDIRQAFHVSEAALRRRFTELGLTYLRTVDEWYGLK